MPDEEMEGQDYESDAIPDDDDDEDEDGEIHSSKRRRCGAGRSGGRGSTRMEEGTPAFPFGNALSSRFGLQSSAGLQSLQPMSASGSSRERPGWRPR